MECDKARRLPRALSFLRCISQKGAISGQSTRSEILIFVIPTLGSVLIDAHFAIAAAEFVGVQVGIENRSLRSLTGDAAFGRIDSFL